MLSSFLACLPWCSSFGYLSVDGKKYSDNNGHNFGPPFAAGDTVGCGIHFGRQEVFFTKNGKHLGPAASHLSCLI